MIRLLQGGFRREIYKEVSSRETETRIRERRNASRILSGVWRRRCRRRATTYQDS
jgi:hypothetical protein